MTTFLKTLALIVSTLVCHSVLTVYQGFTSDNCSGKKTRFESWADLSESTEPVIRSYKWSSDETIIEGGDCRLVQTIENLTVTEAPLKFYKVIYDPSDWFFADTNWSSNWTWSVEYAETRVNTLEQCVRSKIADVLNDDEASGRLSKDVNAILEQIEESKYGLVVGDPMGVNYGGFYAYSPPTIHIDVLELLIGARIRDWSPTAYLLQVLLHEMIHAGRRQEGTPDENINKEEAIVWELTYNTYKALLGDKEPPYSKEGKVNKGYDRVQHKLSDGDLCR